MEKSKKYTYFIRNRSQTIRRTLSKGRDKLKMEYFHSEMRVWKPSYHSSIKPFKKITEEEAALYMDL